MRAVKGVYENGVVTLAESVPLPNNQEVTVWVPTEPSPEPHPILRFAGMLKDLTPEQERVFDETIERGLNFDRRTET